MRWALVSGGLLFCLSLSAQPASMVLPIQTVANGTLIELGGQTFGPFVHLGPIARNPEGSRVVLVAQRTDGIGLLADGQWIPLPAGATVESLQVALDGQQWLALWQDAQEAHYLRLGSQHYGPFTAIFNLQLATEKHWLLVAQTVDQQTQVWIDGQLQGTYPEVPFAVMAPDASFWAFTALDAQGQTQLVTSDRTWSTLQVMNLDSLRFDTPFWAYHLTQADGQAISVVSKQIYPGYSSAGPLQITADGRHWGFAALKVDSGTSQRVVVIDGQEFPGQSLLAGKDARGVFLSWLVTKPLAIEQQSQHWPTHEF